MCFKHFPYSGQQQPRKKSKTEKSVFDEKGFNESTMQWFGKHIIKKGSCISWDGTFEIPVTYLEHPELGVEARAKVTKQVNHIIDSMKKKGILKYNIVVLIWKHELVSSGLDTNDLKIDMVNKPNIMFQVICGDHTSAAFLKLHNDDPNNKAFKKVKVHIIVCDKTSENERFANNYGGLDNYVANTSLDINMVQMTINMHRKFMQIDSTSLSKSQKNAKKQEVRDNVTANSTFKRTTVSNASAIAAYKGKVWDLLEKVFTGKHIKGKPKGKGARVKQELESISNFIHMSKIPENHLCRWLQRVVDGKDTPKAFETACKNYKKTVRVQGQILDYVTSIRPRLPISDWEDLCEHYPIFQDEEWINQLVGWTGDQARDQIGPQSKSDISDKIKAFEAAEKDDDDEVCLYL